MPNDIDTELLQQTAEELQRDAAFKQYLHQVQTVLFDCQYIEAGLKLYIELIYRKIRERISPDLHFKYSERDLEKQSLGKLIVTFDRLSDEAALVVRLRRVVEIRNKCAHSGYLVDTGPAVPVAELGRLTNELKESRILTAAATRDLFDALKRVNPR